GRESPPTAPQETTHGRAYRRPATRSWSIAASVRTPRASKGVCNSRTDAPDGGPAAQDERASPPEDVRRTIRSDRANPRSGRMRPPPRPRDGAEVESEDTHRAVPAAWASTRPWERRASKVAAFRGVLTNAGKTSMDRFGHRLRVPHAPCFARKRPLWRRAKPS